MGLADKILVNEAKLGMESSWEQFFDAAKKAGFKKGATNLDRGEGSMNADGLNFDYSLGSENVYIAIKEFMVKDNPEGLIKAISAFSKAIRKLG